MLSTSRAHPQQLGSYEELACAVVKRFTPVRIQAVQTSLFMRGVRESQCIVLHRLSGLSRFSFRRPTPQGSEAVQRLRVWERQSWHLSSNCWVATRDQGQGGWE